VNKKWIVVIFSIFVLGFSLVVPGCISNTLKLIEIHIPDGEIGYLLLRIDAAYPKIIYDKEALNIELIFNKELSNKQDIKIFEMGSEFLPKALIRGSGFEINNRKIVIKEKISLGISSFLIPQTLSSNNDLNLNKDLYIYLFSKPFESAQSSDIEGVQKISKRKGDGKTIGFSLKFDSLPVGKFTETSFLNSYSEIPLFNKPEGEKILSLKNGDGFEIIAGSDNFYKVEILYKKDLQSKVQKIQGYIEKKFVYKIPEPLNDNTTYNVFSQQFLCVVARKIMNDVPESLPYFPYIDVRVSDIGDTGVELLEQGALPVTAEKMSILELSALFDTIVNSTDIKDNTQNEDLSRLLNEDPEIQEYYKTFIANYTKTLIDAIDQIKVPETLTSTKQTIFDYINLKSSLLNLEISLYAGKQENFNDLLNNFLISFHGDKKTEEKVEEIINQILVKQSEGNFNFNDFLSLLNINIFKPIESGLSLLIDEAFFPNGNWIKEEFTQSKAL
jgi:hypothetical protein